MLRKTLTLAAWAVLLVICVTSLSPIGLRPSATTEGSAISQRFIAYLVLGLLFVSAYPSRFIRSLIFVVVVAFGLEAVQQLTQDRHGRLVDAMEKAAGGLIGCCVARSATALIARRSRDT
jgi:VanZ family protein